MKPLLKLTHDIAKATWLVVISLIFRDGLDPSFVKKFGETGMGVAPPQMFYAFPLCSETSILF